jgi:hypothetical protein
VCTTSCSVRPASVTHYLDYPFTHACSPSTIHLHTQHPTQPSIQLSKYKLVTQKSTQPLTIHPLIELSHSHLTLFPTTDKKNYSVRQLISIRLKNHPTHPLQTNRPSSHSSLQTLTDPHMNVSPSKPVPV